MTDTTEADDTVFDAVETGTDINNSEATEPSDTEAQGDTEAHDDRQDRDAAKYRRRLRETEAQRDTLTGQVEALQRAAIDAQTATETIKPAALWASGVQLADLLHDDGTVDPDKVTAACSAARDILGLSPKISRHVVSSEGGNPSLESTGPGGRNALTDIVMGRQ